MRTLPRSPRHSDSRSSERYASLQLIHWWDQAIVSQSTVLLLGAGAVGNEVAKNLALSGIGRLVIVDFDTVEASNLARSALFRMEDDGKPKAKVAASAVRRLNPEVEAVPIVGDVEWDLGHGWLLEADAVVGCLDSIHARLVINRVCRRVGREWINTGISALGAEVALFGTGDCPCYECTLGPDDVASANDRFSCTGFRLPESTAKIPTTAVTASLAGAWATHEALALVHRRRGREVGSLQPGQRLLHTLRPLSAFVLDLCRSPHCPHHGEAATVLRVGLSPTEASARDLLDALGPTFRQLHLGFEYVRKLRCAACGHSLTVNRPKPKVDDALRFCSWCERFSREVDGAAVLAKEHPLATRRLAALGVPPKALLLATGDSGSQWIALG